MTLYLLLGLSWLLVVLTLLVFRLIKEREPETRWRLLFVAAAAPFVLFPLVRVCSFLIGQGMAPLPVLDSLWPLAILTAAGGAVALIRSLVILRRQRALLACCQPVEEATAATLLRRLRRLSRAAGLRQVPRILLYPGGANVCALGARQPTIILSRDLLTVLGPEELEAVLAHEVAHLRRRDYLLNWLGLLARSAFFYLPPWSIGWRVLAEAREQRADRLTVTYTGDPLAFAAALIKVWRHRPEPVPVGVPGLLERPGNLEARVRRLIEPTPATRPLWRSSLSVGLLLGGLLVVQATVEGGTHTLARVSPEVAAWEACCDPKVSLVPHCATPRRIFLPPPTMMGSSPAAPDFAWTS